MREYSRPGGVDPERMTDADEPDTQEIRVEIEQTRTELSGTIDAIQQRLAPETLTEQAKDVARDAADQAKEAAQAVLQDAVREVKDAALEVTEHAVQEVKEAAREVTGQAKDAAWDATVGRAEDAVSSAGETARGVGAIVIDTIKANPIPAALAGASLYWLYRQRSSGSGASTPAYGRTPYPPQQAYPVRPTYGTPAYGSPAYGSPSYGATTSGSQGQSTVGAIGDTVSGAASQVGDVASDVASSAGRLASDAASTATQVASSAASTASEYASSAGETAIDTGSDIIQLIKANPIPAALVGLGLGWLYMNRSSGPDYRAHSRDHYRYPPEARYGATGSYGTSTYGSGASGSAGSQGGVGDMARQAGSQVSDLASGVQGQVSDLASGVQEQVGDLADAVIDRTTRAPGQIQRMINDNPLLTAALAATVGAAAGLALPPTQTEDHLVGKSRDRMMGMAQDAASDAIDKVQSVAAEVQHTATREAQAQGLTV